MSRYRKRPVEVEAVQWRGPGTPGLGCVYPILEPCRHCGYGWYRHGRLYQGMVDKLICPGDWVLTREDGERIIVPPDHFESVFGRLGKEAETE